MIDRYSTIAAWSTLLFYPVLSLGTAGCDGGSPPAEADATLRTCDAGGTWNAEVGSCTCGGVVCPEGTSCSSEGLCAVDVEPVCADEGAGWTSGDEAFRDASESWNLDEIAPRGVRLSVTDLEGDGWPDLVVRRASSERNRFGSPGDRTVWLLRNTGDGSFEDVTRESGLLESRVRTDGAGRPAQVIVWGDVDNDGDLDAYTGFDKSGGDRGVEDSGEIMLNQGDGTFELGPLDSDLRRRGEVDRPSGAAFVDFDRDGELDLWVGQYATGDQPALQDRLYRGDGDGGFTDVTEEVGLSTEPWGRNVEALNRAEGHSRAWSADACDLNDDGWPELMAGSYGRAPNHLWRADATDAGVAFTNISVESGYAYDDQTDWSDNASARCYCELNPDATGCAGVPEPERIPCEDQGDAFRWNHATDREAFRLGGNTGTTVCADIDVDGEFDVLTNEIRHWDVGSSGDPSEILYQREGDAIRFERPGREATGLTREHRLRRWNEGDITSAVWDFDNDGRPDIYIGSTDYPGTRGHLWHQEPDGTFEKVSSEAGIDHRSSHGVALADFDRDGDVDIAVGHSRARCGSGDHCYPPDDSHVRLFENRVGQEGNWLQLTLAGGEGANRAAIGARVEVTTGAGTRVQEVDGGHGHYGMQHDRTLHFGLGAACRAEVTVRWPDAEGTTQTFELVAGHRYRFEQGSVPEPVE